MVRYAMEVASQTEMTPESGGTEMTPTQMMTDLHPHNISPSSSSGEEFVDLDREISSSESDFYPISPKSRDKIKKELDLNVKEISEDTEEEINYRVLGHREIKPTTLKRTVPASWVSNANKFASEIVNNNNLLLVETNGLRSEFFSILQIFTTTLFPVQKAALPILLRENLTLPPRDVVICSPTGSGKTLCYVLPILNKLANSKKAVAVFALIIAPAMDLAEQILSEFAKFNVFDAKIVSLIGKCDYSAERLTLFPDGTDKSQAHIIVATPGRLVEHLLDESGEINLEMLRYLVIDEADRMQDIARMEWLELVERHANVQTNNLLNVALLTDPNKNTWLQRILVSATLSLDIEKLHTWNLRCPQLFKANKVQRREESKEGPLLNAKTSIGDQTIILPDSLDHRLIQCKPNLKPFHLYQQIEQNYEQWRRTIVFANKRVTTNRLVILISKLGEGKISVAEFNANLYRKRRLKLLQDFKEGKIRVLISCDLLSRGIDLCDVDCVINYDVPVNERIFVHRAGRTARAMKKGLVLSFTTKGEKLRLRKLLAPHNLLEKIDETKMDEELSEKEMQKYQDALSYLKNTAKTEE